MEKIKNYLEQITNGAVSLDSNQLQQFEEYYEMLVEKNKVMNLTAITEREEVILKHFIDSLAIAGYVKLWEQSYKIIDVGTGAGFPGIPLKIAFENNGEQVLLSDTLNTIFPNLIGLLLCLLFYWLLKYKRVKMQNLFWRRLNY